MRGHDAKPKNVKPRQFARKLDSKIYFITTAQNATPKHEGFYATIRKAFMPATGAELTIIATRYKNATSQWTESQQNAEWWDFPERELYNQRKKLNNSLILIGDIKIQPTAVDPLTGMESLSHGESAIFGHTKLRMQCVATPQNKSPKILTTTGAITVPNYTDSKAGKKGEFHHVLGGVIVEIVSDKKFHLHHVNARKDGAFIWKDKAYYPDGRVEQAPRCKAIVFGDAHYRFADPEVVKATFGKGGLVETLNPEALIFHDLLDAYAVNVHHTGNPFIKKAKHEANFHVAEDEVRETVDWVCKLGKGRENYIAASNHDNMLARWILREDWKEIATENIEFYLETALQMAKSAKMTDTGAYCVDPFGFWVEKLKPANVNIKALARDESLTIGGIECSYHGDLGPSGARGTIKNLGAIGVKVISGHGHSPAIWQGHYRTGTMTRLTAEYTQGPGAWLNTHCSIDAFNKRHLHTCVGGKFWL